MSEVNPAVSFSRYPDSGGIIDPRVADIIADALIAQHPEDYTFELPPFVDHELLVEALASPEVHIDSRPVAIAKVALGGVKRAIGSGLKHAVDGTKHVVNTGFEYAESIPSASVQHTMLGVRRSTELAATPYVKSRDSKLVQTAIAESKDTRFRDKALLAGSVGGYVFEVGPGNEWAVAKVGKEILKHVIEQGNVALSSLVIGAGIGLFSVIEHTALGSMMYRNIKKFPKTVGVIRESAFGNSKALRNSRERGIVAKFGNAFSVGAATVNLEDSFTDPNFITEDKGYKRTRESAILVGVGSLAIGAGAGAGIQHAANTGNAELAQNILDLVSNPFIVGGVFAAVRANDYRRNRKKSMVEVEALPEETVEREVTKLPESIKNKITTPVAMAALVAIAKAKTTTTPIKSELVDTGIRSAVSWLNRKGKFNVPK